MWEFESEALEEDGLVSGGLGDAAFADLDAVFGRQHNVDEADLL